MSTKVCSIEHSERPLSQPKQGTATDKARADKARWHALILPREHGAWGLLLVPLVTGAGVAFHHSHHVVPVLLLLTAALALFWMRTPVESLLATSLIHTQSKDEQRTVLGATLALAVVAALSLGTLLWAGRNPFLWLIGCAAATAFVTQAILRKLGRSTRMLAEVVGTIGLTGSAPAAYYVVTGRFDATACMLWLANLIFAGNQIHYVQLRIHTARIEGLRSKFARGWTFALGQAVMAAALVLASVRGYLPALALIAFVPVLFRGWFYFFKKPTPLQVRRLGWNELTQAVIFCVLFIGSFSL